MLEKRRGKKAFKKGKNGWLPFSLRSKSKNLSVAIYQSALTLKTSKYFTYLRITVGNPPPIGRKTETILKFSENIRNFRLA
jgi:hypothetical protein